MHDIKEKGRYVQIKERRDIIRQRPPRRLNTRGGRFYAVSKKLRKEEKEAEQTPVDEIESFTHEVLGFTQHKAASIYSQKRRNASHYETHFSSPEKPIQKKAIDEQGRGKPEIKERVNNDFSIKEKASSSTGRIKTREAVETRQAKPKPEINKAKMQAAKTNAVQKVQVKASTSGEKTRRLAEGLKRAVTDNAGNLLLSGGGFLLVLIPIVLIIGVAGLIFGSGESNSGYIPVSQEVEAYSPIIQSYANEHGIPEYTELIKAVMMQESGGRGNDPMQASECGFNTQYPKVPNGITDPEYSIDVGIANLAACILQARVESPIDIDGISLALQGYNYGNGYITWAMANYDGYSTLNAIEYSDMMAARLGWSNYGDKQYVSHVLRYYPIGRVYIGSGNQAIVDVAITQLGNVGGEPYWTWCGYDYRIEWCACFVSWCAAQCGITEDIMPQFIFCPTGVQWFMDTGRWQGRDYTPSPGDVIFFDWEQDGIADHVGIVEKCEDGIVYTVEGNVLDSCAQRQYPSGYVGICGYGFMTH